MNRQSIFKLSIFIFLTVCIISCKESRENYLDQFEKTYTAKHSAIKLNGNEIFYKVHNIKYINNKIVAFDQDETYLLSLLDLNKKEIVARFGKKGQGPNELIGWPTNITKIGENKIRFFVGNNYRYFDADIQTPDNPKVEANKNFSFNKNVVSALPLTDGYSLLLGGIDKGRYSLIDSTGNQICVFSEYPHFEGDEKFTNYHKSLAFQGEFARHPSGKRVCFATTVSQIIEIIEFDTANKKLQLDFNWQGELGHFVPEGDGTKTFAAAIKRETKTAFLDVSSTEKYIYLLYSGRIIGQEISKAFNGNIVYVMDWNGKPVARYNLDIDVKCITVSDDDKTLYAIAEQDDTDLVKFNLNH